MKNIKVYILKNSFKSSLLLNNKGKVSFSFVCLLLFIIAFSSTTIEAEPISNIIKQAHVQNSYKVNTASVTYRTVHSFHDKKRLTAKSNNNYVIFSPDAMKSESNIAYPYRIKNNTKSFYTANFFEKAMRFNDTLQTWVQ